LVAATLCIAWAASTTSRLITFVSLPNVHAIDSFRDLMLHRHDYGVNVAGGFGAAQLTSEYATANGFRLPMKRRAHTRGADRQPILDMLMVSIDISDVSFT